MYQVLEEYPAFLILAKNHEFADTKNSQADPRALSAHLRDFAKVRDFPYYYGLSANLHTMTFVNFCKKEDKCLQSQELSFDPESACLHNSEGELSHMKHLFFILFSIIQEAENYFELQSK